MPAAIALVAAVAVVLLWQTLRRDHEHRVANVAEATSYATRSELARRLTVQFESFRQLAEFWASSSDETQAPAASQPEPITFAGIDAVAWLGADGRRFLALPSDPSPQHVPTDAEWRAIAPGMDSAPSSTTPSALGPAMDEDGHAVFRYYVPVIDPSHGGMLLALIDAHDLLEALLVDESLGYAVRVTCCNGKELYRRGVADEELPGAWTRDGWITPAEGIRWNVRNRPSPRLGADLSTSAVDSVLVVGLALAFLLGGLVFQTRRANERAAAAQDAEERVHRLNRELEDRVLARTQRFRDALADLNTVQLAVSHDLRSPLNAISLSAGQLRDARGIDSATADRCERIASSAKRMTAIMDRLLGYSRSALDSELEDIDMHALVLQVLDEQSIPADNVKLGELPPARADSVIVRILLSNLIANAVKHGHARHGVGIEVGSVWSADGVPAYFVRDAGPGLDAELAGRLFKPATQPAPGSRGGLGLGLAIAARAAQRHGGRIWVDSAPGSGATFFFTLQPPTPPAH